MTDVVDENGKNHTHYDLDVLGRRTTEKIYDLGNNLVQETDFSYGNSAYPGFLTAKTVKALDGGDPSWVHDLSTQYVPDANGRVAQEIVDPNGLHLVTQYTFDANGNKLSSTDPKGHTTWFSYDSRNRLVTVTYADGSVKRMTYDARGNKITDRDENGNVTVYQYDALNRLQSQTREMNGNGPRPRHVVHLQCGQLEAHEHGSERPYDHDGLRQPPAAHQHHRPPEPHHHLPIRQQLRRQPLRQLQLQAHPYGRSSRIHHGCRPTMRSIVRFTKAVDYTPPVQAPFENFHRNTMPWAIPVVGHRSASTTQTSTTYDALNRPIDHHLCRRARPSQHLLYFDRIQVAGRPTGFRQRRIRRL